jgi:lipoprotein-anchoring transpeptidase ErfK/SrfK
MDALTPPNRRDFESIAITPRVPRAALRSRGLRLTTLGMALACGAAMLTAHAQAVLPGDTAPAAHAMPATPPVPTHSVEMRVEADSAVHAQPATRAMPPVQDIAAPLPPPEPVPEVDPIAELEPGEFIWKPELAPVGDDTVVVVSLPQQLAHVYRNNVRIGVSTVSTGKPGHETPTGVFPILQKREEHYSNLYDNAPMPFMQRLTWDGIALHAGRIPGHPASHGCVRLPKAFAKQLFGATGHGTIVVVADHGSHGEEIVMPGDISPVDPSTGLAWSERRELIAPTVVAQAGGGDPRIQY